MEARREALDRQFAVCDPDFIHEYYKEVMGSRAVYDRDEWVYKKVYLWAPTLAYYVESFDLDFESAKAKMVVRPASHQERGNGETVQVEIPVADPGGDSGGRVVVRIRLHKHSTGHWRVFHVGFADHRDIRAQ